MKTIIYTTLTLPSPIKGEGKERLVIASDSEAISPRLRFSGSDVSPLTT
jgi:hypothetical protein